MTSRGNAAPSRSAPLDTDVAIETPEHIVFHYRVAGPARRVLAYVLDLALCYGAVALLALAALLAMTGSSLRHDAMSSVGGAGAAGGFVLVALFAAQWLYFVVWEGRYGRSPGKMAVGLRVVATSGRPPGWSAALLRNLLRAADLLPAGYVVGLVSMSLSSRFQRLGDVVADTMVVLVERTSFADPIQLSPPAEPRELIGLPQDVALSVEERDAIELFLRRRSSLGLVRERELAAMIAPRIGDRLGFVHEDPSRLLALVYDRSTSAGRAETPSLPPGRGLA